MWYLLLFPRTVSFFTGHGLREDISNPHFLHLWIASFHVSHSFLMTLLAIAPLHSTAPCPLRCVPWGCPTAGEQHLNGPRVPGTRPWGVSLYTHRLQHCSPNPLAACKRERTLWGKVLQKGRTRCWSGAGRRNHWTNSSRGKGRGVRPQELQ